MSIRLSLVCHASTSALRSAAFPRDEPLDAFGIDDAEAAAAANAPDPAALCWSAPELRARQTAAILDLPSSVDFRLRDCDYGQWSGATLAEIQRREPDALNAWLSDPAAAPHGGESLLSLLARIGGWLDHLRPHPERSGATRVIAVTHPAVIRAAIVHALCAAPASFWRVDIAPLSRVTFVGQAGRWTLRSIS